VTIVVITDRLEPGAGTIAAKGLATLQQLLDYRFVGVVSAALPECRAVPGEAVGSEGFEDLFRGAGLFPGWVQVFHPHQPAAAVGAGVEIGGEGANE
jgi:hypothetical protein